MHMRILAIAISLFFFSVVTPAQETLHYFDVRWMNVAPEKAYYIGVSVKQDSVWLRSDYYVSTKKIVQDGFYKDSACTIKHGMFRTFFSDASLHSAEDYRNNKRHGLSLTLFPNGVVSDSFYFKSDIPVGICASWYPTGQTKSEMQMDTMGMGTGVAIGFFEDATVSFKGKLSKGARKTGNWFYYHANGNRAAVLQYPNESALVTDKEPEIKQDLFEATYYDSSINYLNATCYTVDGVQEASCTFNNKFPDYPKGVSAWSDYLGAVLGPIMQRHPNVEGPIMYKGYFVVQTDGTVAYATLDNKINAAVDADILSVFKKSKKWVPAFHNNRMIPYYLTQTLTLNAKF